MNLDRRVRRLRAAVGVGIVLAVLLLVVRRTLMVVRVQGSSMLPAYADGERLLAVRPALIRRLSPGDVVVVRAPAPPTVGGAPAAGATEVLVKRVRAVGGDPLPGGPAGSHVPPGACFVQGDDSRSYDSRAFGVVDLVDVVARVLRALDRG